MDSDINKIEYGGHCAFAVSVGKKDVMGGHIRAINNGKTYLFSNQIAKVLFLVLPGRIRKADAVWKN